MKPNEMRSPFMGQVVLVAILAALVGVIFVHQKEEQKRLHEDSELVRKEMEKLESEIVVLEQHIATAISHENLYEHIARSRSNLQKIDVNLIRTIPLRRVNDDDHGVAMGGDGQGGGR